MKENNVLLSILPLLSFVIGIAVAIIQLYVTSRQAKLEEKLKRYIDERVDALQRSVDEEKVDKETLELKLRVHKHEILNEVRQWKQ